MSELLLVEQATPATPSTNQVLVYPKADGFLYFKDDAGTEYKLATGGAVPTFVDNETPGGTPNGVLTTFTLVNAPSPAASLMLFTNQLLQRAGGVDYTLSGLTVTFVTGSIPQTDDLLRAFYRY